MVPSISFGGSCVSVPPESATQRVQSVGSTPGFPRSPPRDSSSNPLCAQGISAVRELLQSEKSRSVARHSSHLRDGELDTIRISTVSIPTRSRRGPQPLAPGRRGPGSGRTDSPSPLESRKDLRHRLRASWLGRSKTPGALLPGGWGRRQIAEQRQGRRRTERRPIQRPDLARRAVPRVRVGSRIVVVLRRPGAPFLRRATGAHSGSSQ